MFWKFCQRSLIASHRTLLLTRYLYKARFYRQVHVASVELIKLLVTTNIYDPESDACYRLQRAK